MMLIIPIILAVVSLGVIVGIIYRHYHQITLLNVESLPYMREEKKKEEFIRKKAAQKSSQVHARVRVMVVSPVISVAKQIQLKFRRFVGLVERRAMMQDTSKRKYATPEEETRHQLNIQQLMLEAKRDFDAEDYDTAEKKYLTVLRQESKNTDAYQGLAEVYQQQGQLIEAKETYQFILQINPSDDQTLIRLGDMYEEEGRLEKAVEYYEQAVMVNPHNPIRFAKLYDLLFELKQYETALEAIQQALEIEPQNPKYLDNFTEVAILLKQKVLAEKGYRELRMINPENQKLQSFRQRIDELS